MAVKVAKIVSSYSDEDRKRDEHTAEAVVEYMHTVSVSVGGTWSREALATVLDYAMRCAATMRDPDVLWTVAAEPLLMACDELGVVPPAVLTSD